MPDSIIPTYWPSSATIDTQGTKMLAMLQWLVIGDDNPPIEFIPPPTAPPDPEADAIAHTDVQMEMLRILQEMQQSNGGCSGRDGRCRRFGRGFSGRGGRERTRCTPDNTSFPRRVTDKYYHNHGGCNHDFPDCTKKTDGHNDAATIQNRLGGLNAYF